TGLRWESWPPGRGFPRRAACTARPGRSAPAPAAARHGAAGRPAGRRRSGRAATPAGLSMPWAITCVTIEAVPALGLAGQMEAFPLHLPGLLGQTPAQAGIVQQALGLVDQVGEVLGGTEQCRLLVVEHVRDAAHREGGDRRAQ